MRTSEVVTLPVALKLYDHANEQITRTTVQQIFASLHSDIRANRDASDSTASLALKRHQFLLMGA